MIKKLWDSSGLMPVFFISERTLKLRKGYAK